MSSCLAPRDDRHSVVVQLVAVAVAVAAVFLAVVIMLGLLDSDVWWVRIYAARQKDGKRNREAGVAIHIPIFN